MNSMQLSPSVSKQSKIELLALLEEQHIRQARKSFRHFVMWIRPDYEMNWHHRALCDQLQAFAEGRIKRLAVFMPPQHGKSELVSRLFPAWFLGLYPDRKVAGCSYNTPFAQAFNRDVQRIIDSPEYAKVYPKTTLNGSNVVKGSYVRNADQFDIVGRHGGYRCAGVGGALTGFRVDMGIIDDPIKDRAEAESSTFRARVWDWYLDVFSTRQHKDSQTLLTMTRWHHDDLAGRVLTKEKGWEVLNLPRIKEEEDPADPRQIGETLWPNRHSLEDALRIQEINPYGFSSLQQQRPSMKGGGVLKVGSCMRYDEAPHMERVVLSVDCNAKEGMQNDNTSIQAWGKLGPNYYLLDDLTRNMAFGDMVACVQMMVAKWSPETVLIEDKANGPAVIDSLKRSVSGIRPINPVGGKIARAEAVSELFAAGNIYIPYNAPFISAWIEELMSFPSTAHDDRVDACTQALAYLHIRRRGNFA